ncbi:MAG: GNAT family N-acetyltransferase, partial [Actinomycetales bacterium]
VLALDDVVRLERRDGSVVDVPRDAVLLWRVVPDRPRRSRRPLDVDPEDLTRITSRGWAAVESVPLGDWELRASGGFTGRACSVAVHGDPGVPLDAALASVESFYRERDLPPLAQVVVGTRWHTAFLAARWRPSSGARPGAVVQVSALGTHRRDPEAVVSPTVDDDWLALYGRLAPEHRDIARTVLEGTPTVGFVSIGEPAVAIGRVVVTGEWAGVAAVEVRPDLRRQGLGRRVVETALAWAVEHGADKAYLQTMRDNAPALALYAPFGFVDHHEYVYLVPPA